MSAPLVLDGPMWMIGCGNMGASHATAYHTLDGFELVGLVSTGQSKHLLNAQLGGGYAVFDDYTEALHRTQPDMTWLDADKVVSLADVNAVKLPRNVPNPRTGRIPGSYDLYEDGDFNEGVPGDDIDTTNEVFYCVGLRYAFDADVADHVELDHVALQLRVDHLLERLQDLLAL